MSHSSGPRAPSLSARSQNRLLRALAEPHGFAAFCAGKLVVHSGSGNTLHSGAAFPAAAAAGLISSGAAAWDKLAGERRLVLTSAGQACARRLSEADQQDAFVNQHRALETGQMLVNGEAASVSVNLKENPLLWLHRRRGRNEAPLIDDAAFAAGERFRAEFERAGLLQRVSTDWSRLGSNTDGGRHAEPGDMMLCARSRVRAALDAVGPDFSGPLMDLLCFDKGLETIEQERNWPQRSGKLIIRFALAALARHYGYDNAATGAANKKGVRRWAAPSQSGDAGGLGADAVHQ
jgi:hypothetical protein